jgi:hypothetical protein
VSFNRSLWLSGNDSAEHHGCSKGNELLHLIL